MTAKKRLRSALFAMLLLTLCFALTACGGGGNEESPADTTTEPYSVQLTSGNYTVGIDLPSGTYHLTAAEGYGDVYINTRDDEGYLASMAAPGEDGYLAWEAAAAESKTYQESIEGLTLEQDQQLFIDGALTLELTSEAADTSNLTPREPKGEECTLEEDSFVAGEDFEPGVYDIEVVRGNGNVASDNRVNGGINSIMGTDTADGIYEKQHKNVELPEGATLHVTGGITVKLVPSASASDGE